MTGYHIRPSSLADAEGINRVHVGTWKSSYKGIIKQSTLDQIDVEERLRIRKEVLQSKRGLSLVGLNADQQIVGFCEVGKNRGNTPFDYEMYALYVSEEAQGSGVASLLFEEASRWLHSQSQSPSMIVWTLAENPRARKFYEKKAGIYFSTKDHLVDGTNYPSVSYKWDLVPQTS